MVQPLPIREFSYLDNERLEDFLSPLVGGLPAGSRQITGSTALDPANQRTFSWDELKQTTPAFLFDMLVNEFKSRKALYSLDSFEKRTWNDLEEGAILDLPAIIEFSAIEDLFDRIGRLKTLLHMIDPQQAADPAWQQVLAYMQFLDDGRDSYNVRIRPTGAPSDRETFVASLDRRHLRSSRTGITGKHRVLGRVQEKLTRQSSFELFNLIPGFDLSMDQISGFLQSFQNMPSMLGRAPQLEDFRVTYPAMVLTVVAIYR
jgi:hypothetical protein